MQQLERNTVALGMIIAIKLLALLIVTIPQSDITHLKA
jgi:hypothetical protein